MIWIDVNERHGARNFCTLSLKALGLCLAVLAIAGCGQDDKVKLFPVKGVVKVDGKPVQGALLTLYPKSDALKLEQSISATTKADGSFTVGTFVPEDGAPAGEYTVTIFHFPPDAQAVMMSTGVVPNLLPPQYSNPQRSGLSIHVKEEPNEVPTFELKGKKS